MYALVAKDGPSYGIIRSRHRSRHTAECAWGDALRRLRRQPGQAQSWLDYAIVEVRGPRQRTRRRINLLTGEE